MNSIINPWVFYWISIVDKVKELNPIQDTEE